VNGGELSASLLLSPHLLGSQWFRVFSLFVAINTLVYLGLTVSKFIPWPRQVRPRQVRAILGISPMAESERLRLDTAMVGSPDPYVAARHSAASASISTALALFGVLVIVVTLVDQVIFPREDNATGAISLAFGVIALVAAITLGRRREHARTAIWIWSVLATMFVLSQCWQGAHFHNPLDVADAIIVVVIIPPVSLAWGASLISSGICASATTAAAIVEYGSSAAASMITLGTAVIAGLILLYLRASAIDRTTTLELRYRQHSPADPQTGLLSWDGLCALAPNVFELADANDLEVHMVFVKIAELDRLRSDYGEPYVQSVVEVVARSLQDETRGGELLARRNLNSFALLGLGARDGDRLRSDLERTLEHEQTALGKRPISLVVAVKASTATSAPTTST
jgi:hypothetical protein